MALFTEFCCRSGGNNLNAGTLDGLNEPATTPVVTYAAGNYTGSSGVYVAPVGADMTEAVVGRFMSVYADGDTNPTTAQFCIGRITAVVAGTRTITMATRVNFGTAMGTTSGNRSARIGGAWKGPNGAIPFPYAFITALLTDAGVNRPRINLKNDQTYALTAGIVHNLTGPTKTQGYTSTYDDGGRATFDGGTSGASYVLFTNSGSVGTNFEDVIFQNNGATGSASLVEHTTSGNAMAVFRRCVFAHSRGYGLMLAQASQNAAIECEAYDCNQSATANLGGFYGGVAGVKFIRCVSHHNRNGGTNSHGFVAATNVILINCVASDNTGAGVRLTGLGAALLGCDLYNNDVAGFSSTVAGGNESSYIENCNFFKNGGAGINVISAAISVNFIVNCVYGNGTMANASGPIMYTVGTDYLEIIGGTTIYPTNTHPWADPDNGDFSITNPQSKGTGRGQFFQTYASWTAPNTRAYSDVGAAQHRDMVNPTYGIGI